MKQKHLWLAGVFLVTVLGPLPALAEKAYTPPPTAPVPASELKAIYGDRTWLWSAGGGRFDTGDNRFSAYTREGGKPSVGQGHWVVDDNGKLCILAKWYASNGNARAATCFGHVRIGDTIFQRRHPFGHWYVFRHAPERKGDESAKIVSADTVASHIRQWQASTSGN
jgi:hypothetical protein